MVSTKTCGCAIPQRAICAMALICSGIEVGGIGQLEESLKDLMKNLASGWFAISTHKNCAQVRPITPLQAMYVRRNQYLRSQGEQLLEIECRTIRQSKGQRKEDGLPHIASSQFEMVHSCLKNRSDRTSHDQLQYQSLSEHRD
jgi:hypothetical protein